MRTQNIRLLLSLVDIRHEPTQDDKMMINYLYHYAVPFALVATKADKLAKTRIKPRVKEIATSLKVGFVDITATSAETGYGKDDLLTIIENAINLEDE